jgi:hypothetical protein
MIDKDTIRAVCKDEKFITAVEYDLQMAIQEINVDWDNEKLFFFFKNGALYESGFSVVYEYLDRLKERTH